MPRGRQPVGADPWRDGRVGPCVCRPRAEPRAGLPHAGTGGPGADARADPLPRRSRPTTPSRPSTWRAPCTCERASLQDDPHTTLFFGRVDTECTAERFYIGRRHVDRRPRRPAGRRLAGPDLHGLLPGLAHRADGRRAAPPLRRRPRPAHRLRGRAPAGPRRARGPQPDPRRRDRAAPRRARCATSSRPSSPSRTRSCAPERDQTICVQGAPGTGKTAVGLHRAAWLLYAFRDRLARSGVLVVGPNRAFLDHIGAVLPALGEVRGRPHDDRGARSTSVPVRGADPTDAAVLKGDARLAEVLRRAVWSHVGPRRRGPRRAARVAALAGAGVRGQRDRRRAARPRGALRRGPGAAAAAPRPRRAPPDGALPATPPTTGCRTPWPAARGASATSQSLWPALDPAAVLFDAALGRRRPRQPQPTASSAPTSSGSCCGTAAPRARAAARWSPADAVLLDEVADLLERTPSLGHVVLDEAQDLSPMQLRAVGRRCATGSATVLGDIAQGTTPWATASWEESLGHLGKPGSHVEVLDRGFRVPGQRHRVRRAGCCRSMAPGLGAPVSVRDNPGRLAVERADRERTRSVAHGRGRASREMAEPGSIGVIAPDALVIATSKALQDKGIAHGVLGSDHGDVDHQVDVVPASVAKGLEFDRVVVRRAGRHRRGRARRAHGAAPALRRARPARSSALTVVHSEPAAVALALAVTPGLTDCGPCPHCSPGGSSTSASSPRRRTATRSRRSAPTCCRRLDEPHRRYHTARHVVEMLRRLRGARATRARSATARRPWPAWRPASTTPSTSQPRRAAPTRPTAPSSRCAACGALGLATTTSSGAPPRAGHRAARRPRRPGARPPPSTTQTCGSWLAPAGAVRRVLRPGPRGVCRRARRRLRRGRSRVLQPFLRRDTIYATRHGQRTWSDRARVNLAREMSRLAPLVR